MNKDKIKSKGKIIYVTDHSRATGFGNVGNNVCIGLANAGFEVYLMGWGLRSTEPLKRENYILLPSGNTQFGEDVLGNYIVNLQPDILITQADTRQVSWIPELLSQLPCKPTWIFYPVIDGNIWDVQCKNNKWPSNWLKVIKSANEIVAMTDFGKNILEANGVKSTTIYHGVDLNLFKPTSYENIKKIRNNGGLPDDAFIVGGVFKNMQRKNPQQYLQAFKIFLDKLPKKEQENCLILLHTNPRMVAGSELDLIQHAYDYGIPERNIAFSSVMMPPASMPMIYQLMDVYLQLGGMEGFCIPLAEAMACGKPIIATDSTTHPELLNGTGLISPCPTFTNKPKARVTYGTYNGVEGDIANPWDVANKIYKLYKDKSLRIELGIKAAEQATKSFDLSMINEQWINLAKSFIVTEEQIPNEWKKLYEETKI